MTVDVRAFAPLYLRSQYQAGAITQTGSDHLSVTVAASNGVAVASVVFPGVTGANISCQIRVANKTSVWVHINFGVLNASISQAVRAATLNDFAVAPGAVEVLTVDPEVNASSVFADGAPSGSTSVMFTRGSGT